MLDSYLLAKLSGPKRSIKITDYFTCILANVNYCITCTACKKLYIGETGRQAWQSAVSSYIN